MLFLMTVRIQNEAGNAAIRDPAFGEKMQKLLKKIKAEAAYFTTIDGQRAAHIRCLERRDCPADRLRPSGFL